MNDRVSPGLQNTGIYGEPMYFSMDWLNKRLPELQTEEEKLQLKMIFVNSCSDLLLEETGKICEELEIVADRKNDLALKAFVLVHKSYFRMANGDLAEANRKALEAEKLALQAPFSPAAAIVLQMCAFNYWVSGQRDKALEMAYAARNQLAGIQDEGMGWSDFQLAVFHSDLKDYDAALKYFEKAAEIANQNNAAYQLARVQSGMGSIAIAQDRIDDALKLNEQALAGYRQCGHTTAISRALNDLGVIYLKRGDIPAAKKSLTEAMESRRAVRYVPGLITSQIELSKVYLAENSFDAAQSLLEEALDWSVKTKSSQKAVTCHMMLSSLHKNNGNYAAALEHLEKGYELKTILTGDEASNRIKHLSQKHATEQADKLARLEQQKNVELKQAYDAIEEQNKSILDSINYAQRIQSALLGSMNMLRANIEESFVLYKPKDIVSGDFWWCAEQNNEFYFSVADCTGHGVPGAFMSLLNINLLNRALAENENASPAHLLEFVRAHVIESLNRDGAEETRDGMDAVLCSINKSGRLRFACANNTLVHIRKGAITVYDPDKFPVGLSPTTKAQRFTEHELQLEKGDVVYMSTDGFADQFGGPKGKKYKQKRLRDFFHQCSEQAMNLQENLLDKEFEQWRGKLEQVDDVLIMGFRYS